MIRTQGTEVRAHICKYVPKGKETGRNFPLMTHEKDKIVCGIKNITSNSKICMEPQNGTLSLSNFKKEEQGWQKHNAP